MTDDVRYSNWVFSIQWIPNFHRVDATNLVETAEFSASVVLRTLDIFNNVLPL